MSLENQFLAQAIELHQQGRLDEASLLFDRVLGINPNNAAALYSLCVIQLAGGHIEDALTFSGHGVDVAPQFAPLYLAHASALQAAGRNEDALVMYDKALEINPDYTEVLINSGVLLRSMHRHLNALERFNTVISIDPDHILALANCAIILTEYKQSEKAIEMFQRLLTLNPDYPYGWGLLLFERLHICDWNNYQSLAELIKNGIRQEKQMCKSFAFMSLSDLASEHYRTARIFAAHQYPKASESLWNGECYRHEKIRLAYVSPDLREHPVGHLMAGIFEHHDKSRFETIAISLGIDDKSRLRQRMLKAFDQFIDVSTMGSKQIAQMMRDMEIDIAVDLGGFTANSRPDIFAFRPAPIQVNYLGYPGTMGSEYMDYIIADRFVIPEEHQQFYSEKVAYLPDCYLPTDASIKISERTPTRAECGLPETGFVFCSFNHDYKISPEMFDIWMRLLQQVSGSVLWLMSRSELSQANLRREAENRGVDPNRLIFAQRVPLVEDHLARYRQADLFLDTYPYNAHTTAADALMAGLPVLTCSGNAFPSRVAGSLLRTIGIPELITQSFEDYEAMASRLALQPELLADFRQRVSANRNTSPLFDTSRFCRSLEALFLAISRNQSNEAEKCSLSDHVLPVTHIGKGVARTLDLVGGGVKLRNPFNAQVVCGVSAHEDFATGVKRADLATENIPFDDKSFDYVTAYDFIQYIPRVIYIPHRRNAFVELMNEVYRVLKNGGVFMSMTPAYPNAMSFGDPACVNFVTEQTFTLYFDDVNRLAKAHGFKGAFIVRHQEWQGSRLLTVLEKIERSQ